MICHGEIIQKFQKINLQQARNTLEETKDNLNIQDQQLRFNLANAYETYVNEKDNIKVVQHVFDNVAKKYRTGSASSMQLATASNDLISAQSTYVQAVLTMIQAQVELNIFLNILCIIIALVEKSKKKFVIRFSI